jgi:hypothetical protein
MDFRKLLVNKQINIFSLQLLLERVKDCESMIRFHKNENMKVLQKRHDLNVTPSYLCINTLLLRSIITDSLDADQIWQQGVA